MADGGRCADDDDDPVTFGKKASEWMVILEKDPTLKQRRRAVIALGTVASKNRTILRPSSWPCARQRGRHPA